MYRYVYVYVCYNNIVFNESVLIFSIGVFIEIIKIVYDKSINILR